MDYYELAASIARDHALIHDLCHGLIYTDDIAEVRCSICGEPTDRPWDMIEINDEPYCMDCVPDPA